MPLFWQRAVCLMNLVRQMPGVEIEKDGRIYHNGQFVENLLLNGKVS